MTGTAQQGRIFKNNIFHFLATALLALSLLFAQTGFAAEKNKFPAKPIKVIVPAGAGGSLAQEARTIAPFLEKQLGVPVVLEYITGADGMLAYNKFNREKPDGYSILHFNLPSAIALEFTREKVDYSVKNFTPLAIDNVKTFSLVTHPDRWKNLEEFLQEAKQKKLSLGTTGGAGDLQIRLFESGAGIKFNWVPYISAGESIAAVAGKHIDAMVGFAIVPRPMIMAGKLKALALFSDKPNPILPGAPDFKSLGHTEVPLLLVYGMFAAPPNTPPGISAILERAIKNACADPGFIKVAKETGLDIDYKPASEVATLRTRNYELLTKYKQFLK